MWMSNELAFAVPHPRPLAPFHFVIAPTRHVPAFYDLDVQEQRAIWGIIGESQRKLGAEMELVGIDIGFQDGQSEADHARVHVVPRQPGSKVELTPGVEWVFSEKGSI